MSNLQSYDDYALGHVADSDRRPMWQVLVVRLGYFCCVSQLLLGAALGYGMDFWPAFWAVFFGSAILQVIGFAVVRNSWYFSCYFLNVKNQFQSLFV